MGLLWCLWYWKHWMHQRNDEIRGWPWYFRAKCIRELISRWRSWVFQQEHNPKLISKECKRSGGTEKYLLLTGQHWVLPRVPLNTCGKHWYLPIKTSSGWLVKLLRDKCKKLMNSGNTSLLPKILQRLKKPVLPLCPLCFCIISLFTSLFFVLFVFFSNPDLF